MKNDKEEYRTIYIGGSRNFLLIKYVDSKEEYLYMVYIDYEKAEGWKWSVKCRNINEVRHVLYDMYGNSIERCMKLSELINNKELQKDSSKRCRKEKSSVTIWYHHSCMD